MRNRTLCLLAVLGSIACKSQPTPAAASPWPPVTMAAPAPPLPAPNGAAVLLPGGRTIADVAAAVTPSVVNVFTENKLPERVSPMFSDPFFEYFFGPGGRGPSEPRREKSLGSGVIVSSDGVIVTNNHVVARAEKIRVALRDGRELQAKLVGADPKSDVAVLRVDAKQLPAIEIADSSKLRIGDVVLAIGNPFGIGQTVTMGIVSATGRANMGITDYEDFIQTDAAINPGNSGGALVTMDGRLVGVNTAIVSRTGGYQGIGFAIPSNMVLQVKDSLVKYGKVVRGWLGVAIQDVTEELGRTMNVAPRSGVLVSDVTPGGPAARAGLVRGDVILSVDGVKTTDSAQLRNLVALAGKDKRVKVEIMRDGKPRSLDVTLGELPAEGGDGVGEVVADGGGILNGVSVRELDAATRSRLQLPDGVKGIVVTNLDDDSPAVGMGLRPGDVILEVNRKPTPTLKAFREQAKATRRQALLLVYRDGVTIYMSLSR